MELLIGIPAYNEASSLKSVLRSIPKIIKGIEKLDILVIDDGSTDKTKKIAQESSVIVISHLLNRGLGGALKTIFAYAREKHYDILVTFDADGQHQGSDIKRLIQPVIKQKFDVVIGNRWNSKVKVPILRYLINQFANILTMVLFGVYTSDSQSGLRAFNRKALEKIDITSDGMEVSSEFFKGIKMNNLKLGEININPIYTSYSIAKGQRLDNAPEVIFRLFLRFIK